MISSGNGDNLTTPQKTGNSGVFGFFSSLFKRSDTSLLDGGDLEEYSDHQASNGVQTHNYSDLSNQDELETEVPLLEDLDIDIKMVTTNLKSVILFREFKHCFTEDPDMTGPLLVGLALALALMLSKKLAFGYIYGLVTCGGIFIYCMLNLIVKEKYFMLYATVSVLGYCLFPMVPLSLITAVVSLKGPIGILVGGLFAAWSTITAVRFLISALAFEKQKYIVGYPIFLFYITFVIIIIF